MACISVSPLVRANSNAGDCATSCMALRVTRASPAPRPRPSASAGSTRLALSSSPATGNAPHCTATSSISSTDSKNGGVPRSTTASAQLARLAQLPGRSPAHSPKGRPTARATASAAADRRSVAPRWCPTSTHTGRWVISDWPRLSVAMSRHQPSRPCQALWFRPSSARTASAAALLTRSSPKRLAATRMAKSPGRARTMKKHSVPMMSASATTCRPRRPSMCSQGLRKEKFMRCSIAFLSGRSCAPAGRWPRPAGAGSRPRAGGTRRWG